MKENEKFCGRFDEDNGNSKWWYLNVLNFRKIIFRIDVWYMDCFINGFINFEISWKVFFYYLEEDGDGLYLVLNFIVLWNLEIVRILVVFMFSVLYFLVVW